MQKIHALEQEIECLKKKLHAKETELLELKESLPLVDQQHETINNEQKITYASATEVMIGDGLPKWAIERYSRQILLPEIGVLGQKRLCSARVLVVGAGGLGCPAAVYLAGAGVGHIGIVDCDSVDVTNLHRQILHSEEAAEMDKATSAVLALRRLNSKITLTPYNIQLNSENILDILPDYDVVLDCCDNVPTRYLLNDACVLSKVPLVSGSALGMEGQLTVYGFRSDTYQEKSKYSDSEEPRCKQGYAGPCYRCLFPIPPPPGAVGSCNANGVAGPVPGVIGCLQALEAIKYIVGTKEMSLLVQRMLIFDGESCEFRCLKLRSRSEGCSVCSKRASITKLIDYEQFCNTKAAEKDHEVDVLPPERRVTAHALAAKLRDVTSQSVTPADCDVTSRHILVDVRSSQEFEMCHLRGSINAPYERFREKLDQLVEDTADFDEVTFVCRRGNDSQWAAKHFIERLQENNILKTVLDLKGGLHAWSSKIDNRFPIY